MKIGCFVLLGIFLAGTADLHACSILYYVDPSNGKIYVANNEDYWYDAKAYIQIEPASGKEHARLWYGWEKFAQGGVNEHGLFFDAAVTPRQEIPEGFSNPNGRNVGDEILALCKNVEEAIQYLEKEKIAVSEGHMMLGDGDGKAVVLEWVKGEIRVVRMQENYLIATNFLLSETKPADIECPRYKSIEERVKRLNAGEAEVDLRAVGNAIGGAVQVPREDESGRVGGTLYSSFMDITEMKFVLVPRLDNTQIVSLDLKEEFAAGKKRKIRLQ
jgi:choloylglycine hydrolase